MSKILEHKVFQEYVEKYANGIIDLNDVNTQMFLKEYAEKILLLAPEGSDILARNGMENDKRIPFITMAALGSVLKEIAELRLDKFKKEENDEKCNPNYNVVNFRKLQYH